MNNPLAEVVEAAIAALEGIALDQLNVNENKIVDALVKTGLVEKVHRPWGGPAGFFTMNRVKPNKPSDPA